MKLAPRDVMAFLQSPARVQAVLIYGPDEGKVRERSRQIARTVLGENSDPLNRTELTGDQVKFDPARLCDELSALSLMGGARLIVISPAGDKMAPFIAEAFEGIKPTAYLIVEAGELAASSGLRKLFEGNPAFAALPCYRDEGRALEEAIRATLAALKLRATPDALHYLAANLGNDRGVTQSELEKIALYMNGESELTLETAMQLAGNNGSETIEELCHEVGLGRVREAQGVLARLLHEGEQPVALIRSLLRHFQKLDIALAHRDSGMSVDEAVSALRPPVFFKYAPSVKRQVGMWRRARIASVLNLLLRTEKELKSSAASPALITGHTVQQVARLVA